MEWEQIDNFNFRAKVFGGWIVRTDTSVMTNLFPNENACEGYEWRSSTCFVPDPDYEWIIF